MNSLLVTVGVASYNNAPYIYETLESIRTQSYTNIELIVVDDASTDNSVQIIEEWVSKHPDFNVSFIRHGNNRGICGACNSILGNAKGVYLSIIGSDDIYMPEKVACQVAMFSTLPADYALVYSGMYTVNKEGQDIGKTELTNQYLRSSPPEGNIFELQLSHNRISAPSAMMLTQAVRDVGGYDEELSFEDWDMWLRLSKQFKTKFSDYISVKYRVLSSSAWNSRGAIFFESCIKLLVKHLDFSVKTDKIILDQVREYAQLVYKSNGSNASVWLRFSFLRQPKFKTGLLAILATAGVPYTYYDKMASRIN